MQLNTKRIQFFSEISPIDKTYVLHKLSVALYNDITLGKKPIKREYMDIIKIENGTYKISLSALEAQEYNVTSDTNTSREEMNSSIRRLADFLKENNKIEFEGRGRLSAEIFLAKDGGCEIFLSKLKEPVAIVKSKPLSKAIYRLDTLKSLLLACKELFRTGYGGNVDVYYNNEHKSYYLFLSGIYQKDSKYAFLCEYGSKIKTSLIPYISEHCKCICENNNVEIFARLL